MTRQFSNRREFSPRKPETKAARVMPRQPLEVVTVILKGEGVKALEIKATAFVHGSCHALRRGSRRSFPVIFATRAPAWVR